MDALERLIRPKSVAIIGASADAAKLTGRSLAFLEKYGYRHEVFPVNPRHQSIGRHPCFPDIRSLPHAPDVAIVLVGSSRVPDAVKDCEPSERARRSFSPADSAKAARKEWHDSRS